MRNNQWQKDDEIEALGVFLDEYNAITGRQLRVIDIGESPDFMCVDGGGREVGVELVRAMSNPEALFWQRTLDKVDDADSLDTWIRVQDAIYIKDAKRQLPHWRTPANTMLVVLVMDCPLEDVAEHMDDDLVDECAQTGFTEIWLADYTTIEAYSTCQLYGLKAGPYDGLHGMRLSRSWKPYG